MKLPFPVLPLALAALVYLAGQQRIDATTNNYSILREARNLKSDQCRLPGRWGFLSGSSQGNCTWDLLEAAEWGRAQHKATEGQESRELLNLDKVTLAHNLKQ